MARQPSTAHQAAARPPGRLGPWPGTRAAAARLGSILALLVALSILVGCGRGQGAATPLPPTADQAVAATTTPTGPVQAVKIVVDRDGLYQVTADDLRQTGFDLTGGELVGLALTSGGQPVTLVADGTGLVFFGQSQRGRYSAENVYWLRRASGDGPAQAAPRAVTAVDQPVVGEVTTYTDTLRLEQAQYYLSHTPQDTDHWLWQPIYAPGAFTTTVDLAGRAGGDALLSIVLWGNTQDINQEPDHHAVVTVNGQPVADDLWDGKGWRTLTATVPAETLAAADNTLVIAAPFDTGAAADVLYLDKIEVSYSRRLQLGDGQLIFRAPAGQTVVVTGAPGDGLVLWDVTKAEAAQPLVAAAGAVRDGVLRFRDDAARGQRRYLLASAKALLKPQAIVPYAGQDLRASAEGADYIAVVHQGFEQALEPLVRWRRSQGLRVTVATVQDVYDSFSHGLTDPAAIRDYMRYAAEHWPPPAPRFLLLVGDASYDPRRFLPDGAPNLVPTALLTTHFVGETASDNWFVSLDEQDDLPDMAVGRIPAQSAEQVATVVAKTLAYEQAAEAAGWAGRALFVADNKQPEFQSMSDDLATGFLPNGYTVDKVYLGQSTNPNGEILRSLRRGVGLVNYVGHGSMNVWAQEKIFRVDDVSRLDNASALPFMVTMTCLVGYFHHPQATSMGEELLFKPDGGVVAALVPTSETLATDQRFLAEAFYRHLFGDAATVGEAVMLAKRDLPNDRAIMQDLIETFTVLGDPALRLRRPQ